MNVPEFFQKRIDAENAEEAQFEHQVHVCIAAGCASSGSNDIAEILEKTCEERGEDHPCRIKRVGCMGLCSRGPLVAHHQNGKEPAMYHSVTPDLAKEIARKLDGNPPKKNRLDPQMPFFARQKRVVLENAGLIDPENINHYFARGGYQSLNYVLEELSPEETVREVVTSGLRGRGGGGYPTGLKWSTVAKAGQGGQKYVVCNADEGDPGAFMDRVVLESDPHRILEGMQIAGHAVGANKGYIYIRGEYPLAIKHLTTAIRQARRATMLGHSVCGTTFDFDIELRIGAGAFVCGEETALIASIEGNRGTPRPRPPYPAEYGLWGKPTLINNVETYANIPAIFREGGEWFANIGTETSKGTKVFALAGEIENGGIIEVPMGISIKEIVNDMGGGVRNGGTCKAVQTGGPSGGCIPAQHFDSPVDYESLKKLGSIMGSGGMII
ncbi:MAG TPA: NAD(P)H-dependent oxidoreductase subunit E, partial [Calditrichia bacterium]|nr:NAD(P)H-dependent oxidoreductase subunit E [Calditrichia bacterium]